MLKGHLYKSKSNQTLTVQIYIKNSQKGTLTVKTIKKYTNKTYRNNCESVVLQYYTSVRLNC